MGGPLGFQGPGLRGYKGVAPGGGPPYMYYGRGWGDTIRRERERRSRGCLKAFRRVMPRGQQHEESLWGEESPGTQEYWVKRGAAGVN